MRPAASYISTQLTAAGNGDGVANTGLIGADSGELQVVVATIDTNVVVRVDHSDDAFTTTIPGPEQTITADGTYVFPIATSYERSRPVFVSEAGGTAATVDFTLRYNKA